MHSHWRVHLCHCPLLCVSLLKLDGSLLTSSHETPETKAAAEAAAAASASSGPPSLAASPGANGGVLPKILGALVANIWRTAEGNGCAFLQSQALGVMMVECEGGIVAVSRLARFLLCIYAKKTVDRGALRQKMNNLLTHLQPLHRVYAN